jgi:hypothetical protein
MSTKKSNLPGPLQIPGQRRTSRAEYIHQTSRMKFSAPKTICRVYEHPLIGFPQDYLSTVVDDAQAIDLATVALVDLNRFETIKRMITVRREVLTDFKEAAKRRGCSADVLINSAIAEWNDRWYRDGRPKTFQEICKVIAIDCVQNSADCELLYLYFHGVFGLPGQPVDDSWWSARSLPGWVVELLAKYRADPISFESA